MRSEMKNPYFQKRLKTIEVRSGKSVSELLNEMAQTGFQGKKLGEVVETWELMLNDNVTIFMGLAGSLSTTGQ
ncbi:MAG: deoxyhypusine synthase family protein, partial [Thermoprotei archaeon]